MANGNAALLKILQIFCQKGKSCQINLLNKIQIVKIQNDESVNS